MDVATALNEYHALQRHLRGVKLRAVGRVWRRKTQRLLIHTSHGYEWGSLPTREKIGIRLSEYCGSHGKAQFPIEMDVFILHPQHGKIVGHVTARHNKMFPGQHYYINTTSYDIEAKINPEKTLIFSCEDYELEKWNTMLYCKRRWFHVHNNKCYIMALPENTHADHS